VRELWLGRVWSARAWRVVEDTGDLAVLASAPGSETRVPVDAHGERLTIPADDWLLEESRWENHTLRVARTDEPWSTLLFFDECATFLSWYVNFEQPLARSAAGFDTLDWKLDLLVLADGAPRLKDEDELALALAAGVLDPAAVGAAFERVLAKPPWPTGWETRAPGTEPARLPADWDVVV